MMPKRKSFIQQVIVLLTVFAILCSCPAVSGSLTGSAEKLIDERLQMDSRFRTAGSTPSTLAPPPTLKASQPNSLNVGMFSSAGVNITASALGKTEDSSILRLNVPVDTEIEVSFEGVLTEGSNSAVYIKPNYRYHWFIDNLEQSSKEARLTQKLFPTPDDKPHNVVLKVEKLDDKATAQSTPPVYGYVNPTIDASIQVSIISKDEWNCKGRLGKGCDDKSVINPNYIFTTIPTIVSFCKGVQEQICIESWMSGGAILHDRCCDEHPNGHWCNGWRPSAPRLSDCEAEWEQAKKDKIYQWVTDEIKPMFPHTWVYPPDGTDLASTGNKGEWWKKIARPGTIVSYKEEEPNQRDKDICESGDVESLNSPSILSQSAYSESTPPVSTIWLCSASKPKPDDQLKFAVNPQEEIDLTPLFRGIEDSCHVSDDFNTLLKSMGKTIRSIDIDGLDEWTVNTPIIPEQYRKAFGELSMINNGDCAMFSLPVHGNYYGMPVTAIDYCRGNNNGIISYAIRVNASKPDVENILQGKLNRRPNFVHGDFGNTVVARTLPYGRLIDRLDKSNLPYDAIPRQPNKSLIECNFSH